MIDNIKPLFFDSTCYLICISFTSW